MSNDRCFYCGVTLTPVVKKRHETAPPTMRTKDHVIPKSRGGPKRAKSNLVEACHQCNNEKAKLTIDEYRVVIAYRNGLIPKPDILFNAEKLEALWNE